MCCLWRSGSTVLFYTLERIFRIRCRAVSVSLIATTYCRWQLPSKIIGTFAIQFPFSKTSFCFPSFPGIFVMNLPHLVLYLLFINLQPLLALSFIGKTIAGLSGGVRGAFTSNQPPKNEGTLPPSTTEGIVSAMSNSTLAVLIPGIKGGTALEKEGNQFHPHFWKLIADVDYKRLYLTSLTTLGNFRIFLLCSASSATISISVCAHLGEEQDAEARACAQDRHRQGQR